MNYDIKQIDHWDTPEEDGAPLLCMPNCPLPMHSRAPREIMGQSKWNVIRKKCYADANYTCQASGKELGQGHCHAHETYSIDWVHQTMTFKRAVCLDPHLHTIFIHSGRALTLFERGEPYMTKQVMLETLEEGFTLIHQWNKGHPDAEPLRVSGTFIEWGNNPQLSDDLKALVKKYEIKFYDFDLRYINAKNWPKWKLVYDGKEYPTKFKNQQEWEEHFKPKSVEKPVEKVELPDEVQKELDKMLGGEK